MRPQGPRGFYFPVPGADFGVAMRMEWVVNAAPLAGRFAHHQESHILVGVVQDRMRDAGAGGK